MDGTATIIVLLVVLLVLYFVLKIVHIAIKEREIKDRNKEIDNQLKSHNVTFSKVLEWKNQYNTNMFRVIVDDVQRNVYVSKGIKPEDFDRIPYDEIIDYQVKVNEELDIHSIHYIEKKITTFTATIFRKNLSKPNFIFDFAKASYTKPMDPKYYEYKSAVKFAEDLHATLKAIKTY